MNKNITEKGIEAVVGPIENFCAIRGSISFKPISTITFSVLEALSKYVGTDRIDLDFGYEGSPGYSEYTPSSPGSPGEIIIYGED